jgi:hypothetical protein
MASCSGTQAAVGWLIGRGETETGGAECAAWKRPGIPVRNTRILAEMLTDQSHLSSLMLSNNKLLMLHVLMRPIADAHYIHWQDLFARVHGHVIPATLQCIRIAVSFPIRSFRDEDDPHARFQVSVVIQCDPGRGSAQI